MKIYTQTYDLAKASPHRFWVAPFSEFKIGIKILEKDEISSKDFTLKAGSIEFTPDEDKIDNFTLFTIKSNDTGFVDYTIEVEGVAEKLKLMQIVTDSTVFEIDASGGDVPADVATQTWVNSQISDFVEEDALTAYYTKNETSSATEINTALAGKQPTGNYLTAETEPAFAAMSADIVVDGDLTAYYTKSETSSATELADAFAGAGGAISAFDMSENPVWSKTMVENALKTNTPLPQTIVQNVDNSISVIDFQGDINFENPNEEFTSICPNAKKIIVGTNVTTIGPNNGSRPFAWMEYLSTLILPETITNCGDGVTEWFSSSNVTYIRIPDSLSTLGINGFPFWNALSLQTVDFGNTRKDIPPVGNPQTIGDAQFYVPDNLYDDWILSGGWSNVQNQIHRHSELEAPYATSTALSAFSKAEDAYNMAEGATISLGSKVDHIAGGTAPEVTNIETYYESEYTQLSVDDPSWEPDPSTMYVILPDQV